MRVLRTVESNANECKEVRVRHLSMADDLFEGRRVGIDGGYVVIPERVSRLPANLSQQVDRLCRCAYVRDDAHVARYPHEPRLGHRAGRPGPGSERRVIAVYSNSIAPNLRSSSATSGRVPLSPFEPGMV